MTSHLEHQHGLGAYPRPLDRQHLQPKDPSLYTVAATACIAVSVQHDMCTYKVCCHSLPASTNHVSTCGACCTSCPASGMTEGSPTCKHGRTTHAYAHCTVRGIVHLTKPSQYSGRNVDVDTATGRLQPNMLGTSWPLARQHQP